MDAQDVDVAVAAWREDGRWQVAELQPRFLESVDTLTTALRHLPGEGGTLGLVSVCEEFFVVARVLGDSVRLLLSDSVAALDWPLAEDALEVIGAEPPDDDEDDEEPDPVGDFTIVADLGLDSAELEMLCLDEDLLPIDQLSSIAARIGFGDLFDELVGE